MVPFFFLETRDDEVSLQGTVFSLVPITQMLHLVLPPSPRSYRETNSPVHVLW